MACWISDDVSTHWGRVTHICVGNLTIIGPDNGLSPGRRQAIIWSNAWISLIGPWGTNFSEILIGIQTFSFKKMHLKMPSAKWRPFCLGLNVLMMWLTIKEWVNYSTSWYPFGTAHVRTHPFRKHGAAFESRFLLLLFYMFVFDEFRSGVSCELMIMICH